MSALRDKVAICKLIIRIATISGELRGAQSSHENKDLAYQCKALSNLLMRHKVDYHRKGGTLLTHIILIENDDDVTYQELDYVTQYLVRMLDGDKDAVIASFPYNSKNPKEFNILVSDKYIDKLMSLNNAMFKLSRELVKEIDWDQRYIASLPTIDDLHIYLKSPEAQVNMV